MPTPLPTISLAGASVGSNGSINLANCAPTNNPAFINKNATLLIYNESGVGLRLTGKTTGVAFDLPAGGWVPQPVSPGETEIDYTVLYVLQNQPVSQLIATYYAVNEPVVVANLGNSPIGLSTNVPLNATATAVANDGNVSGTNVVESSVGGVTNYVQKNQGLVRILMDATSGNQEAHDFVNLAVGGHTWGIFIDTSNALSFFDNTSGKTALALLSTGAVQTDNGDLATDGSGNITAGNDTLRSGIQEGGHFVLQMTDTAISAISTWVRFRKKMTNVPSSITLSGISSSNINAQSATSITTDGFTLNLTMIATGSFSFICDWVTVGN